MDMEVLVSLRHEWAPPSPSFEEAFDFTPNLKYNKTILLYTYSAISETDLFSSKMFFNLDITIAFIENIATFFTPAAHNLP